jgi:catalase
MTSKSRPSRVAISLLGLTFLAAAGVPAKAEQPTPVDLVDALNGVFGKHPGDRAAHTKGICLTGTFTPSADAPKLSKAPHFAKEVPITARLVKYKLIPEAGELGLTPEEAQAKGPDFYAAELKDRLAKGPASFDLTAIMGKAGDPTADPTLRWDDEDNRPTTPLGKISVAAIAPDATCDVSTFLPGNVVDGIAGSADDPIFQIRSADYLVSFARRKAPAPQ